MDAPELVIDDLKFPTGIASDEEENLFVADAANGSVQKLDRDGRRSTYIAACGTPSARSWAKSSTASVSDAFFPAPWPLRIAQQSQPSSRWISRLQAATE